MCSITVIANVRLQVFPQVPPEGYGEIMGDSDLYTHIVMTSTSTFCSATCNFYIFGHTVKGYYT